MSPVCPPSPGPSREPGWPGWSCKWHSACGCTSWRSWKRPWCCFLSAWPIDSTARSTRPSLLRVLRWTHSRTRTANPCSTLLAPFLCFLRRWCIGWRAWRVGKKVRNCAKRCARRQSGRIRWSHQLCRYCPWPNCSCPSSYWDIHSFPKKPRFRWGGSCWASPQACDQAARLTSWLLFLLLPLSWFSILRSMEGTGASSSPEGYQFPVPSCRAWA